MKTYLFNALANSTRYDLFMLLFKYRVLTLAELMQAFSKPRSTLRHHLGLLIDAGLVLSYIPVGRREAVYTLNIGGIDKLIEELMEIRGVVDTWRVANTAAAV